jgi:hypothetical protein
LGGVQPPRQISLLLSEILSACVAGALIVLQSRRRRFHVVDFGRLLGQLAAEIRDRFVSLFDLGAYDFAIVTRIAQLFFQRDLILYAWLGWGVLGNLSWVVDVNAISVEANG